MALIDDFKARFPPPVFATSVVDQWVPILEPNIDCYYGGAYTGCGVEIILNLVAHLVTIEGGQAGTGGGSSAKQVQTSKSVGSVSVGYAGRANAGSSTDEFFASTRFGQTYLLLIRKDMGGRVV